GEKSMIKELHALKNRYRFATLGLSFAIALAVLIGFTQPSYACTNCNCYFSSNCSQTGRGTICRYTWNGEICTWIAKPNVRIGGVLICGGTPGQPQCDGRCRDQRRPGAIWRDIDRAVVATAFNLYLKAYLAVAQQGGGGPDPTLLKEAMSVPLPSDWHEELQEAIQDALDVLIGFDFMRSRDPTCPFGQCPALSDVPFLLVDTARQALEDGIVQNNSEAVVGPIRDFWKAYQWVPMHTGRCYPHGHPEVIDVAEC